MISGKGSIKAKAGGPHLSEVVQLSWHKGPVAGVLGLMAAGGEAEREEEDRSCEAFAMLVFLFLEGEGLWEDSLWKTNIKVLRRV